MRGAKVVGAFVAAGQRPARCGARDDVERTPRPPRAAASPNGAGPCRPGRGEEIPVGTPSGRRAPIFRRSSRDGHPRRGTSGGRSTGHRSLPATGAARPGSVRARCRVRRLGSLGRPTPVARLTTRRSLTCGYGPGCTAGIQMIHPNHLRPAIVAALAAVLLAGCGGGPPPKAPPPVVQDADLLNAASAGRLAFRRARRTSPPTSTPWCSAGPGSGTTARPSRTRRTTSRSCWRPPATPRRPPPPPRPRTRRPAPGCRWPTCCWSRGGWRTRRRNRARPPMLDAADAAAAAVLELPASKPTDVHVAAVEAIRAELACDRRDAAAAATHLNTARAIAARLPAAAGAGPRGDRPRRLAGGRPRRRRRRVRRGGPPAAAGGPVSRDGPWCWRTPAGPARCRRPRRRRRPVPPGRRVVARPGPPPRGDGGDRLGPPRGEADEGCHAFRCDRVAQPGDRAAPSGPAVPATQPGER